MQMVIYEYLTAASTFAYSGAPAKAAAAAAATAEGQRCPRRLVTFTTHEVSERDREYLFVY